MNAKLIAEMDAKVRVKQEYVNKGKYQEWYLNNIEHVAFLSGKIHAIQDAISML